MLLVYNHKFVIATFCVYRDADELKNEAKSHVLKHVNIVTLLAMIFELGHYGVVLEFVSRGSLEEFIYKYQVFNYLYYDWLIGIYV